MNTTPHLDQLEADLGPRLRAAYHSVLDQDGISVNASPHIETSSEVEENPAAVHVMAPARRRTPIWPAAAAAALLVAGTAAVVTFGRDGGSAIRPGASTVAAPTVAVSEANAATRAHLAGLRLWPDPAPAGMEPLNLTAHAIRAADPIYSRVYVTAGVDRPEDHPAIVVATALDADTEWFGAPSLYQPRATPGGRAAAIATLGMNTSRGNGLLPTGGLIVQFGPDNLTDGHPIWVYGFHVSDETLLAIADQVLAPSANSAPRLDLSIAAANVPPLTELNLGDDYEAPFSGEIATALWGTPDGNQSFYYTSGKDRPGLLDSQRLGYAGVVDVDINGHPGIVRSTGVGSPEVLWTQDGFVLIASSANSVGTEELVNFARSLRPVRSGEWVADAPVEPADPSDPGCDLPATTAPRSAADTAVEPAVSSVPGCDLPATTAPPSAAEAEATVPASAAFTSVP